MKTKYQPKGISGLCAAALAGFVLVASAEGETAWEPLLQLRLRAPDTLSATNWAATRQMLFENPGCCDEVWFSTGIGVPPVSEHVRRAEIIRAAAADLRARGAKIEEVLPSLGAATLRGTAALARLLGYATALRSMTRGRARFELAPDGLAPCA